MTGTVIRIPTLETERLTLRAPAERDFEAYAAFNASPRAAGVGGPFDRRMASLRFMALIGHWHLRGYGRWLVADRDTGAALGVVGLFFPDGWPEPEIAWSVFDHAEGRGIAAEAARAARGYAYDTLGWRTAISVVLPDHARSLALARRLGCRPDGSFEHPDFGTMDIWRHPAPETLQ